MKKVKKIVQLFRKHKLFSFSLFLIEIVITFIFVLPSLSISADFLAFTLICFFLLWAVLPIVVFLTYKGKLTLSLLTQEKILIVFFQASFFIFFLTALVLILFCQLAFTN